MKSWAFSASGVAVAWICASGIAPEARAQALIWIGGGANANWSTTGNWNSGIPSVTAGSTQTLDFAGSTGVASTMNNSYSAASLTFDSGAAAFTIALGSKTLTLDGSTPLISQQSGNTQTLSSGTLAFASNGTIDVTGSGTLAINSKLSGAADITKQGTGTLALGAAGTGFTGDFTVAAGTLQVSTSNTVLGSGNVVVNSGATLEFTDSRNLTNSMTLTGTGVGGAGAFLSSGTGTATMGGAVTLGGDTTFDASGGTIKSTGGITGSGANLTLNGMGSFTISSDITTGSGGLTINSSGTIALSGANTYTGTTTVNDGTLNLSSSINGDLVINGGLVVDKFSGQLAATTNLSINGGEFNLSNKTETVASLSGASGGSAILAIGSGTLTDTQSTSTAYDGTLTGASTGTLVMQGTGTLALTGVDTGYAGKVSVSKGTVLAAATDAAGSGTVTVSSLGNFEVQGGVSLANKFTLSTTGGSSGNGAIENVSGNNTVAGAVTVSGASRIQSDSGTLTVAGTTALAGNTLNFGGAGSTAVTGAITGTVSSALTKDGAGTLTIGVANPSFLGSVSVTGGTLATSLANAFNTTTAINIGAGTTFALLGTSQAIGTLNGAGTVAFGNGSLTLTSGADLLSGAFTGTGVLTLGTGSTLTLGANFNDAGLTIVLAGGTLKLNGTNDTFGSLSITANSVLDFDAPTTSVLSVNGVSFTGTSQLSVTNWTNLVDYFYSTTSPGAQGTTPIDQVVFSGSTGSQTRWNGYVSGPDLENELTPIPEARGYGILISVLGLASIIAVRKLRAS